MFGEQPRELVGRRLDRRRPSPRARSARHRGSAATPRSPIRWLLVSVAIGSRGERPSARWRAASTNAANSGCGRFGPALELGVRLRRDEERVHRRRQLDELDEQAVGRGARAHHAVLLEHLAVAVVELVAVAVPLVHDLFAVDRRGPASRAASFAGYAPSRIVPPMSTIAFCSSMRSMTGCGLCESNSDELAPASPHASRANSITAQCRPRHRPRYGTCCSRAYAGRRDLALDAAQAEPAGHDDAVEAVQPAFGEQAFGVVGRDPVDRRPSRRTRSRRASAPRRPTGTRRAG